MAALAASVAAGGTAFSLQAAAASGSSNAHKTRHDSSRHAAGQARQTTAHAADSGTCRPDQLQVSLSTTEEGMFNLAAVYLLTNTSSTSCQLSGTPSVAAYHDGDAAPVGMNVVGDGSPPAPVTLAPGDRAGFQLSYQADSTRSTPCPHTTYKVVIPGITKPFSLDGGFPVCPGPVLGRTLLVSPIHPAANLLQPSPKD